MQSRGTHAVSTQKRRSWFWDFLLRISFPVPRWLLPFMHAPHCCFPHNIQEALVHLKLKHFQPKSASSRCAQYLSSALQQQTDKCYKVTSTRAAQSDPWHWSTLWICAVMHCPAITKCDSSHEKKAIFYTIDWQAILVQWNYGLSNQPWLAFSQASWNARPWCRIFIYIPPPSILWDTLSYQSRQADRVSATIYYGTCGRDEMSLPESSKPAGCWCLCPASLYCVCHSFFPGLHILPVRFSK